MRFRYYLVSIFNGDIKGTNDAAIAEEFRESQDDFVIDTETGTWLTDSNIDIQEIGNFS